MNRPMPPSTKAMIWPWTFGGVAKPTVLRDEPLESSAWMGSGDAYEPQFTAPKPIATSVYHV